MGQTLTHGVYLPSEGERNCYSGLASNWRLLDGAIGTVAAHTSALAGKAPLVHTHTKSDVTDLLNSNFIPSANNAYDLGSSSNQWNNLYAKNYYYNGVAWGLDKANTWTQSQTISINLPVFTLQDTIGVRNTTPTNARNLTFSFLDKNGDSYGFINRQHKAETGTHLHQVSISNGTYDYRVQFYLYTDGKSAYIPSNDGVINLGTSTNKWKSLNGVNPGALSLPNYSDTVDLDTTNWSKAGDMIVYTPTFDGWLQITIPNDADAQGNKSNMVAILDSGVSVIAGFSVSNILGPRLYFLYPVRASRVYWLYIKSYSEIITTARLIKCMGNV